jgi:hypothetical protein
MSPLNILIAVLLYGIVGIGCFVFLSATLMAHPLFPFQMENLDWTKAWLIMTVADYYGGVLPLCGIVLASEPNRIVAIAWATGILLLGSPCACGWMVWRLVLHQTIRMHDADTLAVAELTD